MEEFKLKKPLDDDPASETSDEAEETAGKWRRRIWIYVVIAVISLLAALAAGGFLFVRHSEELYRGLRKAAIRRQEACHARLLELVDSAQDDISAVEELESCAEEAADSYKMHVPSQEIRHYVRILKLLHRDREALRQAQNEKFVIDDVNYGKPCLFCRGHGKCVYCGATGKCFECRGTGHIMNNTRGRTCPLCDGSGVCHKCHGNPASVVCDHCGGATVTPDRDKLAARSRQLHIRMLKIKLTDEARNDYLESFKLDWRCRLAKKAEKAREYFRGFGKAPVQTPAKN